MPEPVDDDDEAATAAAVAAETDRPLSQSSLNKSSKNKIYVIILNAR